MCVCVLCVCLPVFARCSSVVGESNISVSACVCVCACMCVYAFACVCVYVCVVCVFTRICETYLRSGRK